MRFDKNPVLRTTGETIDQAAPSAALRAMVASHSAAAEAVAGALEPIGLAGQKVAQTIACGGLLVYAAAGSSGLMAVADACELPGTFRIPPDRVRIAMAGGIPIDARMPGDTEDDQTQATRAVAGLSSADTVIALSASGTTPFACAAAEAALTKGSTVIAIANVPAAPLLDLAHVAIAVPTGPEVLDGSTRLAAGTAQKIILNMISTLAGVELGHVHDGMMVNLHADNAKLRKRAQGIVAAVAGVSADTAARALQDAHYDVKTAVLMAQGLDMVHAQSLLAHHGGRLRDCLASGQIEN
ncbi:MAG: N-acetylmuramic acid 6-phosphate etherase [Pseudomonadota bacterium]